MKLVEINRVLQRGGFDTTPVQASWLIRWPTRIFTFFARNDSEGLVARNMTVLRSSHIEALLHPSDLVIRGSNHDVVHAHALITENLLFTNAYQTWSKEANQLEDRLSHIWHAIHAGNGDVARSVEELEAIDQALHTIQVDYEEWEILFRLKVVVDRAACRRSEGQCRLRTEVTAPTDLEPTRMSIPAPGRLGLFSEQLH